jgi:hypothetical protein
LPSIRKRVALLAATTLFATLAVASTPALAATQKYNCTYNGQTRTITQGQYEKLQAEYPGVDLSVICRPVQ